MNKPKNEIQGEKTTRKRRFTKHWLLDFSMDKESVWKMIPFILFLAFWAVIYIANRHYAEKTEREISRLSNEVKDMRADYLTTKEELMFLTKQSEIARKVDQMGLKELKNPPRKLNKSEK